MRRWIMLAAMAAATAGAAPPARAAVESTQVPVVRLHASIEVRAPASAVWAQITSGANLVTWCPMWKSPANAKVNLTHVGAVLEFTDEWGNGGRSVVTYLAPGREIRVAHEPTRGDYMCQAKLISNPRPAARWSTIGTSTPTRARRPIWRQRARRRRLRPRACLPPSRRRPRRSEPAAVVPLRRCPLRREAPNLLESSPIPR